MRSMEYKITVQKWANPQFSKVYVGWDLALNMERRQLPCNFPMSLFSFCQWRLETNQTL